MEKQNYNINNNMILTIINYQNKNFRYTTKSDISLTTFYNEICNYFQTNPDENLFYYQNKPLMTKNNTTQLMYIIDLQNKNSYPCFIIKPAASLNDLKPNLRYKFNYKIKPKQKIKITLRHNFLKSRNKKSLSNNISSVFNTENNPNSITTTNNSLNQKFSAVINEVPSINDIEVILNDFNLKNQNSNYITINTENNNNGTLIPINNNTVKVSFESEILLNEFISYITYMKYQNPYYKNMKIVKNKTLLTNKQNHMSHTNVYSNHRLFKHVYNHSHLVNKPININEVIKAVKKNELKNGLYHGLSLKTDGEDEIIKSYYKQQMFLRNSSPYISENEKRILEEKESKKKDYDKRQRFITSVGHYSMKPNYIANYVGMTPSENPKTHSFRDIDKSKWITNKGFNL